MQIPHLTLHWNKDKIRNIKYTNYPFDISNNLSISFNKQLFNYDILKTKDNTIHLFGVVFNNNKIDNDYHLYKISKIDFADKKLTEDYFQKLNGQFLIIFIDNKLNNIHIINDRFNSFPIYFANLKNEFLISHLYFDIFKKLHNDNKININQEAIIEFLWFRRTFGNSTYDNLSKFLLPASILSVNQYKISLKQYWQPKFNRKKVSSKIALNKFDYLLKQSAKRLTSDKKKYSIFLSAGHDSRIVLSSLPIKPHSYTVGFSYNLEAKIAKSIANDQNSDFTFIELNQNHFINNLDNICKLCGGQYSFYDCLFAGIDKIKPNKNHILFHGHGLDFLFAGLYSPYENFKLFGSPTFFQYSLLKKNINLAHFFTNNVKFRTKGINTKNIIKESYRKSIFQYFEKKINNIIKLEISNKNKLIDNWDSIIVSTLGKHYSKANLLSMQTYGPQRTLVYDNDIYNFYLELDTSHTINSKLITKVIKKLSNSLGSIPTTNYGLPASNGPFLKTIKLIIRKIKRIITNNQSYKAPLSEDKTFPNRDEYLNKSKKLKEEIENLFNNEDFKNMLTYIDWDYLDKKKDYWLNNKKNNEKSAQFLFNLLSVYKLFELSKNN